MITVPCLSGRVRISAGIKNLFYQHTARNLTQHKIMFVHICAHSKLRIHPSSNDSIILVHVGRKAIHNVIHRLLPHSVVEVEQTVLTARRTVHPLELSPIAANILPIFLEELLDLLRLGRSAVRVEELRLPVRIHLDADPMRARHRVGI